MQSWELFLEWLSLLSYRDVKKVLSNKRDVKQLSNELTAHVLVGIISQKVMPFKPMTNSCMFLGFRAVREETRRLLLPTSLRL